MEQQNHIDIFTPQSDLFAGQQWNTQIDWTQSYKNIWYPTKKNVVDCRCSQKYSCVAVDSLKTAQFYFYELKRMEYFIVWNKATTRYGAQLSLIRAELRALGAFLLYLS